MPHPSKRLWPLAILGIACLASTVVGGSVQGASRTVTFCNRNALNVEVAWGFDHAEKGLTSAGRRTVAACACRELFTEELRATEIWLLVTKEGSFDTLNDSHANFCVKREKLRFATSNKSQAACEKRNGHRWIAFQAVDVTTAPKINFRSRGQKACNLG
jgi:uncharacterized membrane protein